MSQHCLSALSVCHQIVSVISIGLVADVGNIAADYPKLAVVYGTLIGFTMISIIVIVGSVMNNGINRTLVSHYKTAFEM